MEKDDIAFLKEFREKVDQYLFLGYSPSSQFLADREGQKKMKEALKDPEFQRLRDTIRDMEFRAHKLLAECHIENIRSWPPYTSSATFKYRIFDLVTENRSPEGIEKAVFLDKIDEALKALKGVSGKGALLVALPVDSDDEIVTDVRRAIEQIAYEHGLVVTRVEDLEWKNCVTNRVLESIEESEFFIVDLTNPNPEKYYEAGYAQGIGKTPIYIAREGTDIRLNLKGYQVIFFDSKYELMSKLSERLHRERKEVF